MIAKCYRRRDVISHYYGGETIASNKINQAIADALSSNEERKFLETVEVASTQRCRFTKSSKKN